MVKLELTAVVAVEISPALRSLEQYLAHLASLKEHWCYQVSPRGQRQLVPGQEYSTC